MLVSTYDAFVQQTDQSHGLSSEERRDIAIYGLASEVGSVVAAIKKRLLAGGGAATWNVPDQEITDELGDVIWYCFSLARIVNPSRPINIFALDISNLKQELSANNARAMDIARVLPESNRTAFLQAAEAFPRRTREMEFEDYQDLAFLTARTQGRELAQVCLAVLWQLTAQLFRHHLPETELQLNRALRDKPINDVLGEIAWHISALASIFGLKLSDVAAANMVKVSKRWDTSITPLHDENFPPNEQFPRTFEIAFVSLGAGRSRMYLDGERLGDDLTDNAYEEDGYRFHDVMHVALVAKLGWSPVLRSLMGRKRRSLPRVDEVEDGARARIVEEAVIKAIHAEGEHLAILRGDGLPGEPLRLFPTRGEIGYGFLKFISTFVADLEVAKNAFPEWEDAIMEGFQIFDKLRRTGGGTITVDLIARSLSFTPRVFLDLRGRVVGLGSACQGVRGDQADRTLVAEAEQAALKRAVLEALGLPNDMDALADLTVARNDAGLVSVEASGAVQDAIWARKVVCFKATVARRQGELCATTLALSDD